MPLTLTARCSDVKHVNVKSSVFRNAGKWLPLQRVCAQKRRIEGVQLLTYAIAESIDAGADKSCEPATGAATRTIGLPGASRALQTHDEARRFFATVRIVVSGDSCKCPREGKHGLESLARKSPLHKDRVRIPGDADVQTADLPASESVDFDDNNARLAQGAEAELRPYLPGSGVEWYNRLNIRNHVSGQVLGIALPFPAGPVCDACYGSRQIACPAPGWLAAH